MKAVLMVKSAAMQRGPRGGKFYITKQGKKVYGEPGQERQPAKAKPKGKKKVRHGDVVQPSGKPVEGHHSEGYMHIGPNRFAMVERKGDRWVAKTDKKGRPVKGVELYRDKSGNVKRREIKVSHDHVVTGNVKRSTRAHDESKEVESQAAKQRKEHAAEEHKRKVESEGKKKKKEKKELKEGHVVQVSKTTMRARGLTGKIEKIKDGIAHIRTSMGKQLRLPVNSLDFAKALRHDTEVALTKGVPTFSGHKLQGRRKFQGMKISIENQKGSYREGVDPDGKKWRTYMNYPYGYIRGTQGVDKDHVDCYIGPNGGSDRVYVIHQNRPDTGEYDEDKVMLGFNSQDEAKSAYYRQYDKPDRFFGSMTEMSVGQFKKKAFKRKGVMLKAFLR